MDAFDPLPLTDALCAELRTRTGATDARPGSRLQQLWSGYGEIRRIHLEHGPVPTLIAKHVRPPRLSSAAAPAARRSHQRKLQSYAVELAFYEQYASRCPTTCRIARPYVCQSQPGPSWLFVLEDLDASGYPERRHSFFRPGHRPEEKALAACLHWLAHFHAYFLGTRPTGLWEAGTYWHLATRPDELELCTNRELQQSASWLDRQLRLATYQTLVHGDAKVENFCFSPDAGPSAAVDFQYVGGGVGVQDVAYFFSSCLDSEGCLQHAPKLLDSYFGTLASALKQYQPGVDTHKVEAEWRRLYPIAWADFSRFLSGWAPEHHKVHAYGEHCTKEALASWKRPYSDY